MLFPHCLSWSRWGVVHVISTLFVLDSLGCSSCDFLIVCVGLGAGVIHVISTLFVLVSLRV